MKIYFYHIKYASDQNEKKKIVLKVEKLRNEIEELKKELDLGKLIKGDSFVYQNIKFDDIQKSLRDDQAILYYVNYPNNIYYGVITKDKSEFKYKYSVDEKILPLIKSIRNSISYKNGALTKFDFNSSYDLYGELIEPFHDYISDKKDLIIVPHGSLLSIPFEILVDQIPKNKSLQNENWLIKKYNITYFPSISSYHAMKKLKKIEFKNHFAGFGDPKLSKTNKKIVSNNKIDLNKIFLRGGLANVDEIRQFAELPKTANELKLVSGFFDKKDIFLRENFNEKKIKSINLKNYTVLSFATHGIVANEISGAIEPGLITSPPTEGTLEDDGVLNTSEIKNLDLNAELVILSACNTAAGDGSSSAEGLSGLTSAFFYAGARSLLVSHWYVEDESTVNLMTQTFSNLGENSDFSEALRNSKLSMIENQETSHPIFWAPFVLVGGST
jgi:CHAT domain-containing protein